MFCRTGRRDSVFCCLVLVFCFLETGSLTVDQVVFKLTKIQVLLPSAFLVLGLQVQAHQAWQEDLASVNREC